MKKVIKLILIMLIIVTLMVAVYEIVFQDVLEIFNKDENVLTTMSNANSNIVNGTGDTQNVVENIENINPTLGESSQGGDISPGVSHYYYSQLDESAKIIYQALENNINNMQNGIYKINFGTQFNSLINGDNGEEKLNIAFQSAWNAFTYDYVDIFYIDVTKLVLTTQTTTIGTYSTHEVDLSKGDHANYFAEGFNSYEEVKKERAYIANVKKQVVSRLQGISQYEQILHVHNWLIDNLEYDTTYNKQHIHDIYGSLKNASAVCEGYARTFKYIIDGLGIPCVLVSGTGTNSEGETESHAWNYVQLEGKWYAIDVTWDDPLILNGGKLTDKVRYRNFLKGSEEFFKNHREDGSISPKSIRFKFPILEKANFEK